MPLMLPAFAADLDTWFGGSAAVLAGVSNDGQGGVDKTLVPQPELDARFANDWLYARIDLDLHVDAVEGKIVKPWPPEWAMLQLGRERYHLRLGVTNPQIGVEDWDFWNNYLPTFSTLFDAAKPGQIAGAEPGIVLGDGTELFAFGGYDMAFEDYTGGAGVATEKDLWGTWSGFLLYPRLRYYTGFAAFELYPAEEVTLTLDGGAGSYDGAGFVGAQFLVNLLPEEAVAPSIRFEGLYDPDEGLGGVEAGYATVTASGGVRVTPHDWVHVMLEAKAEKLGDQVVPGGFLGIAVARPDPDSSYDTKYEEKEGEKAEGRAARPARHAHRDPGVPRWGAAPAYAQAPARGGGAY